MELKRVEAGKEQIAEVVAEGVVIRTVQDALDLLATANYRDGATCLLLEQQHLLPEFFDLKTGIAGEILQKYTNYGMKLVIIGDFAEVPSKSLSAFILESNRGKQVAFMPNREAALAHIAAW